MPEACSAYGCTNRGTPEARRKGLTLHSIPADPTRREAWIKAIRQKNWEPGIIQNCFWFLCYLRLFSFSGQRARICSEHFLPDDFDELSTRRNLKASAVPSVFPAFPTYYQTEPQKKRRKIEKVPLQSSSQAHETSVEALKKEINHDHTYNQPGAHI